MNDEDVDVDVDMDLEQDALTNMNGDGDGDEDEAVADDVEEEDEEEASSVEEVDEVADDDGADEQQGRVLPSYVAVEHPGYVQSTERAIAGLGGPRVLRAFVQEPEKESLELRFRPQNRFEHPIQSATAKTSNLLIRIKRTRDAQGKDIVQHEPVAVIKHAARFRGMCDYQWATKDSPFVESLEKAVSARSAEEMAQFTLGPRTTQSLSSNLDIMPPPVFSNTTVPHNYNYKQNPAARKTQTASGVKYVNRTRGMRQHLLTITFEDEVPVGPSSKLSTEPNTEVQDIVGKLKDLFAKRPMWTRRGLANSLSGVTHIYNLKFALPYVAYMWKSGPWRDCYVKYGVDPRSDNSYAKYQAIYCLYKNPVQSTEPGDPVITPSDSHIFDGRTLHPVGRTFMLIDMTDPLLVQIRENAPLRARPHPRDGWWHANMITATRKVLSGKTAALCNGRIPSDLDYTDMLRLAGTPDSEKDRSSQVATERDVVEDQTSSGGEEEGEEAQGSSSNSDNDTDRDESQDDDDDLDRRVESLVEAMIRPSELFNVGTSKVVGQDAFAGLDQNIFGSDADD